MCASHGTAYSSHNASAHRRAKTNSASSARHTYTHPHTYCALAYAHINTHSPSRASALTPAARLQLQDRLKKSEDAASRYVTPLYFPVQPVFHFPTAPFNSRLRPSNGRCMRGRLSDTSRHAEELREEVGRCQARPAGRASSSSSTVSRLSYSLLPMRGMCMTRPR